VLGLGMSVAMPALPQYTFTSGTGKALT
jgi:hypothetical protein